MIVHGTRYKERRLGWVADFCPICRTVQKFQLIRVGLVSHLYYISFGDGKLIGYRIECVECKTRLETQESRYADFERKCPDSLAALAARTLPDLQDLLGERLSTERLVRETPHVVAANLRATLIQEPFGVLNPPLESRSQNTHLDQPIVLGLMATLLILGLGGWAVVEAPTEWDAVAGTAVMVSVGAALVYTIVQLCLVNRRYYRRLIAPKLVKALRPLEPTRDELEMTLARARKHGLKIAKFARLDELDRQLHRPV